MNGKVMKNAIAVVTMFACFGFCAGGTVSYSIPVLTVKSTAQGVVRGSGKLSRCSFSFVETTNTTPVRVSIVEDVPVGTGTAMRSSVWLAVTTAALTLNRDLSGETIHFETSGYVDGSSAGGVLCLAVMSSIEGRSFPDDFAMTGTIMVDGTIGAVGGVAEKIRAASQTGVKRVCIPSAMRLDVDDDYTDLLDLGKSLGLEIHLVSTIADAYRILHRLPENRITRQNPLEICRLPQHVESVLKNQYLDFFGEVPKNVSARNDTIKKSAGEFVSGLFGSAIIDLVNGLNEIDIANCRVKGPSVRAYPALEHELPTNKTTTVAKWLGAVPSRDEYVKELMAFNRDLKKLERRSKDDDLDDEGAEENTDSRQDGTQGKKVEDWFDDYVESPSEGQFTGLANNFLALNDVLGMACAEITSTVDGMQDWNALDEAGLNEVRRNLIDKLNVLLAKGLLEPGAVIDRREDALGNCLRGSIPYIRPNANIRQVENLFYRTMKALDSSLREFELKKDNLHVRWYAALLRIAEKVHALSEDHEDLLPAAVCSEVQVLAKACPMVMWADSFVLENSAYFSSVVTSARENALANIAECQKLGIPCVMPVICFQCAESKRDAGTVRDDAKDNRFAILENYLDASIGAKALVLCFKGQRPELNKKGYCSKEMTWDRESSSVTVRYLGCDGEPILRGAFSGFWRQYDGVGRVKCTSWLDMKGNGVRYQLTNECFTVDYDDSGKRIRKTYCDATWRPKAMEDGVLFETFGYDAAGNETSWEFYGASSNRIVCCGGIAIIKKRFNKRRQETSRRFYGVNEEPIIHVDGYAGFDVVYDKKGNLRRVTFIGCDGKPVMTKNGYAIEDRKYNGSDLEIERAFYDAEGKLVCVNGVAKVQREYDKDGNLTTMTFFGANNLLTRDANNVAVVRWTYDQAGQTTECHCYGPDFKPTRSREGFSWWKNEFDASGRIVGCKYFDENGNEVKMKTEEMKK